MVVSYPLTVVAKATLKLPCCQRAYFLPCSLPICDMLLHLARSNLLLTHDHPVAIDRTYVRVCRFFFCCLNCFFLARAYTKYSRPLSGESCNNSNNILTKTVIFKDLKDCLKAQHSDQHADHTEYFIF